MAISECVMPRSNQVHLECFINRHCHLIKSKLYNQRLYRIRDEVIGRLHCRHVGGQNKRKFVHKVCIKMAVNSQMRKILLFLFTNMAVTGKPSIASFFQDFEIRHAPAFIVWNVDRNSNT